MLVPSSMPKIYLSASSDNTQLSKKYAILNYTYKLLFVLNINHRKHHGNSQLFKSSIWSSNWSQESTGHTAPFAKLPAHIDFLKLSQMNGNTLMNYVDPPKSAMNHLNGHFNKENTWWFSKITDSSLILVRRMEGKGCEILSLRIPFWF